MKKIFVLLLTVSMGIFLIACGRDEQTSNKTENGELVSEEDVQETGVSDENASISFSDDGIQISDEEGVVSLGGEWPDNEYTKCIPKPSFGTISFTQVSETEGFIVQFSGATIDDTKQYIEVLRDAGYTENEELFDGSEIEGLETYEFSAQNSDGVFVCVDYALEIFMITVTK